MTALWTLFIIIGGYGGFSTPRVAATTIEGFVSLQACEAAAATIKRTENGDVQARMACVQVKP